MYFIVEITPRGAETFLGGFEHLADAWDAASRLRCEPGASAAGYAMRCAERERAA
jgi:hypothetical protein